MPDAFEPNETLATASGNPGSAMLTIAPAGDVDVIKIGAKVSCSTTTGLFGAYLDTCHYSTPT